jgi:hypothetical protein
MSVSTSSHTDASRPPASWPVWLGLFCLAAIALPSVIRGISAWRDDDSQREVAVRFFRELADGHREAALSCLSKEYRSALSAQPHSTLSQPWAPTEDVTVQVMSVKAQTDGADVQVSLAKSGFTLKPTVHLQRMKDQSWRITRIDGVDVDPRWHRRQEREAQEAEEQLADELAEKLHLPAPDHLATP